MTWGSVWPFLAAVPVFMLLAFAIQWLLTPGRLDGELRDKARRERESASADLLDITLAQLIAGGKSMAALLLTSVAAGASDDSTIRSQVDRWETMTMRALRLMDLGDALGQFDRPIAAPLAGGRWEQELLNHVQIKTSRLEVIVNAREAR